MEKEYFEVKKSTLFIVGAFVLGALLVFFMMQGSGKSDSYVAPSPKVQPQAAAPSIDSVSVPQGDLLVDEDSVLGDLSASVHVIEFSDFQCPFCARALYGAVTELKNSQEFKDGEVNFVYKHFPLNSIHPDAQKAAEASECAADQGKFWEYHDVLFENQRALQIADLKAYAKELGLDSKQFDECLDSGAKADKVNADTNTAIANGGQGTPYFIVYNSDTKQMASVSGAVPFANIKQLIDAVN